MDSEYLAKEQKLLARLEDAPEDVWAWQGLGNIYTKNQLWDKAKKAYLKAIELDSKIAHPWNGLGNVYQKTQQWDQAKKAYFKAIELDSKLASPWHGLGNAYQETQQWDQAKKAYLKAIELDSKFAPPWYGLGIVYQETQQWDQAKKAYFKAIELDSKFAPSWYGLGNIHLKTQQWDKSEEAYRKAISLQPDFTAAWNNLGVLYQHRDNTSTAYKPIATALSAIQNNTASTSQRLQVASKVWLNYKWWVEAFECVQPILDTQADHAKALGISAYALARAKAPARAKEYIKKALSIEPQQHYALLAKATLLMQQDEHKAARVLLHQCFDHVSTHDYIDTMQYMRWYEQMGDSDYVERCAIAAHQVAEPYYLWIPKYRLANYFWRIQHDLPRAEALLNELLTPVFGYGKHAVIYLLAAELAFVMGNNPTRKEMLDNIEKTDDFLDLSRVENKRYSSLCKTQTFH